MAAHLSMWVYKPVVTDASYSGPCPASLKVGEDADSLPDDEEQAEPEGEGIVVFW